MVYFPTRKCFHAAKVTLLLVLVIAVLALFEQWRGGKRGTSAFSDPEEADFERQILEDEARIVPGLGEGGVAAYLTGEDKKRGEESEKKLAMNVYLSDRISYNRSLKDHRNPACKRVTYDAELPSASVILIFHNEPYSVVIRTIWSVINSCRRTNKWFQQANYMDSKGRTMKLGYPGQDPNSPLVYLKEIILVDDNSTLPELKGKLSHYVRTRLPPDLIRILRLPDRQGLMQARMVGARAARGDILIFLDAHCEAEEDWMRPLLQRIRHKRDAVITPIIDVIDQSGFQLEAAETFQVGGFTFTGHFTWIDVPNREKKRRGSDIAPTWSPTMAGGLFAINRAYYWELGAYDEQMAGWGGENLEMSFRIWQCGGTLETIPCSRVGHVFRNFHPYGLPEHTDTHGVNTARMAEVWMDEYAELFYLHRPDLRNSPKIGDVTHRKILREKLQCKSFQWYLDNIYKEKFVPVRDAYGYGRFQNPASGLCLDTLQREAEEAALGLYQCHAGLQATQYLILSLEHELRGEDDCAHAMYKRRSSQEPDDVSRKVLLSTCRGKKTERKWTYIPSTEQIQHSDGLCLDASAGGGADVLLRPCTDSAAQRWRIDYSEDNDFRMSNDIEPNEQQLKLSRLRGQNYVSNKKKKRKKTRISRSLLSYSNSNSLQNATVRRHTHKKHRKRSKKSKKTKNKFILKLVRTLGNKSDEHLEVDIHCKHKQLYPNNTFVRDLVSILNDKNIKVINNGRVFERNKVTQLDKGAPDQRILNKMDIAAQQAAPPNQAIDQTLEGAGGTPDQWMLKPLDIAAQQPPPMPKEKKMTKKARKKMKQPQLQPLPPGPDAPPSAPAAPSLSPASEPRAHRIIIEDFVELTPANTIRPKRLKKRKRLRPTASPYVPVGARDNAGVADDGEDLVALFAQKLPPNLEEQISVPPQSEERPKESSEADVPMQVSASERRTQASAEPSDNERWSLGESRFRRNNTGWRRQRLRAHSDNSIGLEDDRDEGNDGMSSASEAAPPPVKVVMRSNLTFNLGDEFFQWQRGDSDHRGPPSDLSIPSAVRTPPPLNAWRHGDAFPRTNDLDDTRKDSDDESSASDSNSSGDRDK